LRSARGDDISFIVCGGEIDPIVTGRVREIIGG